MRVINVEVWADIRCPWCWIGLRRMQAAAAGTDEVQVHHRSFLLEPAGPMTAGVAMADVAVDKWGMTTAQWQAKSALIQSTGAATGLQINIDTALTFDSMPVHRLVKLVTARGDGDPAAAWEAAFDAHFRLNENLADRAVLRDLGASMGVDPAAVDVMLAGEDFVTDVHADMDEARRVGVTSVPTVIATDGSRLEGSASVADLRRFLAPEAALR